jgi:hypothetical protein
MSGYSIFMSVNPKCEEHSALLGRGNRSQISVPKSL